ncbi:urea ABC transporter ATP-binding subunit UrtE [Parageobacillus thermoglucosidasius]|uniref:urea ABC transporter ATP-binding subunit UrtE n=1 Tax=Parageobacillus thermoglucosidasius TaxID=1426 RepID=UPI000B54BFED|nr:urea ABC transporter ATP-binding subunit UrtE [Parageobacillus thermoglucosidasius]MBY6268265.1 urea ABC transporter ATP-binding subunit UrtE [Parageobacillus thermoglucosidasius]OUM93761.1 MAG: urea ABC transporter ATP-binding subunit UrtE [Parageobacillus thermoglucosidasius]REK54029.1 MAG: urea ABC transporter ATP-binding subunit UrtE [Geobacillus sp.]BDG32431.1 ABC transporter ATP-binding protein [Parageobacillus thermoglucosidasius]
MLSVQNVAAGYEQSMVLENVSINAQKGAVTAVLGRNGVGKTTLIKSIIGLIKPMAGKIEWEHEDITSLPPEERVRKGIGYVPQGREIFSSLTVEENLLLGLEALPKKANPSQILAEVYELFPILKEMLHRKGGDLSGGQQQQLAIARALMGQPKLLLLDEPMEGIQPSIVQLIRDVIVKMAKEKMVGIVLVEHSLDLAFSCADYFYIFDRGTVVAQGRVSETNMHDIQQFLTV